METNNDVLNDLIKVNNDRTKGYEKAAKETADGDADLRTLFNEMAAESRAYVQELKNYSGNRAPSPKDDDTTLSGDIYRIWMDMKATFTGKGRKAILASCEFGEDAAQKSYAGALEKTDLTPEVRRLISDQKARLKQSHDKIKRMRDTQPA